MQYFLFLFYFVLILIIISKSKFLKESDLGVKVIIVLFSLKVLVGFFYGYYYSLPEQEFKADTLAYFNESKIETDWLLKNPKTFFADLFTNHYTQTGNLFSCTNSFWNDLKATFFIKALAVLNLLSNKNYYINILFLNLFFLYGTISFYRLFKENFKNNKWVLLVFVFLTPSFLFWCSGIHKDGVVFASTAICFYSFQKIIQKQAGIKLFAVLIICLTLIFLLRNYYLLAIAPSLFAWFVVAKYKLNAKYTFGSVIFVCLLFLFFSNAFSITNSISNSIVEKHNEFLKLEGNTKFYPPSLENNTASFIAYFPYALQSALFRPFPANTKSLPEFLAMIENYLLIILIIFSLIVAFVKRKSILSSPILLACLTTSFLLLLFIGYTVCFDAAIVRYRSVSFPLLLVPSIIILFAKNKSAVK